MRRFYILLFTLFSLNGLFGQNGWVVSSTEEFSKVIMDIEKKMPENISYSYETEYKFYEELEASVPVMIDRAVLMCSKENEIYMEQFGRVITQNNTISVICDTTNKMIVINKPTPDFTKRKSVSDFSSIQTSGSVIQKKTTNDKTIFSIQFPKGFQYSAAEISLGGELGVDKYILYSKETSFENMEGKQITAQPRVEATYKNFSKGNQVKLDQMKKVSNFITLKDGEYVLNEPYKHYELIDLRSETTLK